MEGNKYNLFFALLVVLSSFVLISVHSLSPAGTIVRVTKQQLLASLPPTSHETTPAGSSQLFLTSPSGKYSVFLLRRETSIGAGGFGSDFCYMQIQEAGVSVWESECAPVSNVNTCSLVFSDAGLEIFDGSNSAWDNDVDGEDIETLVLLDKGDMQIIDKEGELVWKASDNPIINQNCGSIGSPGLAPALPPFASPIHGDDEEGPFGQPAVDDTKNVPAAAAVGVGAGAAVGAGLVPEQHEHQEEESAAVVVAQEPAQSPGIPHEQDGLVNPQTPIASSLSHEEGARPAFGASTSHHEQLQPLIDNTPFDSGSPAKENQFKVGVTLLVTFAFFGFLL